MLTTRHKVTRRNTLALMFVLAAVFAAAGTLSMLGEVPPSPTVQNLHARVVMDAARDPNALCGMPL